MSAPEQPPARPELALVDFDDTLVETAPAFHEAREALFRRLEEEGFPREEAHRVHHQVVEPELLALYGMGPFRMEPSFRDTYVRLCVGAGRVPEVSVAEACATLGRNFLGHPTVMEGSLEALRVLARAIPTILYSQTSHFEYQMSRIRDSGVTGVLGEDRILLTSRKTAESFLEVVRQLRVSDPARVIMIGNSLRSDINPALTSGARAILVEPYTMWEYDRVPPVSNDFHRFPSFAEAVEFLLGNGLRPPSPKGGGG